MPLLVFLNKGLKYEPYLCHDLMQRTMNFNVVFVSIKGSDYRIHIWHMSKNDAISIMNDSSLNEKTESFTSFFVIYKN